MISTSSFLFCGLLGLWCPCLPVLLYHIYNDSIWTPEWDWTIHLNFKILKNDNFSFLFQSLWFVLIIFIRIINSNSFHNFQCIKFRPILFIVFWVNDLKLHLMARIQFWSSGVCGITTFVVITPRCTFTWSSSTCYGPIYGSNWSEIIFKMIWKYIFS